MGAIPDRFDLFVRKARELSGDAERQMDVVMGALFALSEWHFLNDGDESAPSPRFVELDGEVYVLIFSDARRGDEFTQERGERERYDPLGLISIRPRDAVEYCLQFRDFGCEQMLVNPGEFGFAVSFDRVKEFYDEWRKKVDGAKLGIGFWIPSMTDEEEDFWQEHGL